VSLTFEQPWWLLVSALAFPAAVMGLSWFGTMSRARAWSAVVLRSTLLALIAGILAGASAVRSSDRIGVIAVVDISESVRQFAQTTSGASLRGRVGETLRWWILEAMRDPQRRPDDLLGVVVFDGQAVVAATPRPLGPRESAAAGPASAGAAGAVAGGSAADFSLDWKLDDGTNIEGALRLAAALFPPDAARRIVLISDGVETAGDSLAAARELAAATASASLAASNLAARALGVPLRIDALPLAYRVRDETLVEAVDVPPQAAAGSTIAVRVSLLATQATTGTLELLYEDRPLDLNGPASPGTGRLVALRPGRNIIELPLKLDETRTVHRLRPIFIPANAASDSIASNNSADAFTVTPGKGRVLIIDGVGDARPGSPGLTIARTLAQAGIDVQTLAPADAPIDVLSLQAYDLVILENVAADEIPRAGHKAMADFVTELGGGLVMIGGPDSFGAGAWKGTDLEPILPVRLDLSEQLLAPSAAVALVIDNSGSMNQRVMGGLLSQQEIANEGAALAVETLDKSDFVAVIAFNSAYSLVVPMDRNSDSKLSAQRVRAIGTGGGTNLYPALDYAGSLLTTGEASKASVRHVIILSDGRSEGNPEDGIAIARALKRRGITVSSIAVGDSADGETLAAIAREGGGQYYEVIDPHTLPRVFIREIRIVRKPLIRETPFRPVDTRSGSRLLAGLFTKNAQDGARPGAIPPLRGLVLTQRRDDPKVNTALVTPEGEPLLAHWFAGRGQVAAFTSDTHDWAKDWLPWPGYAALWTQIARTIARPASERSSELSTQIVDGELRIRLDATDDQGKPRDLLSVPGTVFDPRGAAIPIRLAQTGPGVYESRIPAPAQGNYVVALTPRSPADTDQSGGNGGGGVGASVGVSAGGEQLWGGRHGRWARSSDRCNPMSSSFAGSRRRPAGASSTSIIPKRRACTRARVSSRCGPRPPSGALCWSGLLWSFYWMSPRAGSPGIASFRAR